ncbi:MAG: PEGA domain-containing protein [Byssovorax sp.]
MSRAGAALLLSAALLLQAAAGAAEPGSVDQARIYFDAGVQAYAAGRFAAAVEAFTDAYALAPRPTVLFSLAQAERRQFTASLDPKMLTLALGHFRKYLQEVPEGGRRADAVDALAELEVLAGRVDASRSPGAPGAAGIPGEPQAPREARIVLSTTVKDAVVTLDGKEHRDLPLVEPIAPGKHKVRASAKGYFDEEREITAVEGLVIPLEIALRERPTRLSLTAPPGATIGVDGRKEGEAPLKAAIEVTPGTHFVTVARTGSYPFGKTITLERGQTQALTIELQQTRQRVVAYGFFGAAGAALIASAATGGLATSRETTAKLIAGEAAQKNISQGRLDEYNAALDSRDRLRSGALIALGAAGALGATGLVLFELDDPSLPREPKRDAARAHGPAVSLDLGLLGVGAHGTF